ncbi:PH domain-containing protein [Flammeovirga sp. OC4]|uniref:PH domain-containing protein n=1 Tax=Flammeovirga sp. OC4 TaxID=1382345 RepID=UPI000693C39C|nr:PH domain-containing protein [Flammeovirga sp. OC4]
MKYKSKINYPLAAFTNLSVIIPFLLFLVNEQWLGAILFAPVVAFVIHLFSNTYYIIQNEVLIIKSGFLVNIRIPISEITKIRMTNSLLSSPALSFDRLDIRYTKYSNVLISPEDKYGFIENLLDINAEIDVDPKIMVK